MNLTFALGTLVGIGGAAISSIRLGKKDQEGTERTLGNVLIMSLIAARGAGGSHTALPDGNPDRLRRQPGKPSPTRTTSCSSPCWGCPSRTSFSTSTT